MSDSPALALAQVIKTPLPPMEFLNVVSVVNDLVTAAQTIEELPVELPTINVKMTAFAFQYSMESFDEKAHIAYEMNGRACSMRLDLSLADIKKEPSKLSQIMATAIAEELVKNGIREIAKAIR